VGNHKLLKKKIRLAKIAFGTKRLQILKNRFAALAPRMNMIYVKLNTKSDRRAGATSTALEIVPLEYAPAKTKGWKTPCFVFIVKASFRLSFRKLCASSVSIFDECSQRVHP